MKKSLSIMSTLLGVLVLLLAFARPVAAAGYTVVSTRVNRSGQAVVFIDVTGSSYLANTTSVSEFYSYATYCKINDESGFLACTIDKEIVSRHGGETGYVIMNTAGDKAWFTAPEPKEDWALCSH